MSLKKDIIELRKRGKSYKTIAKELKCSKGSVSYYCTGTEYGIPVEHKIDPKKRLGMAKAHQRKAKLKRDAAFELGRHMARDNMCDIDFIKGIMVYWCEGAKTNGTIKVANSDFIIHNTFTTFMDKYFPNYNIDFSIISYENEHSLEEVEAYWKYKLILKDLKVKRHYRKKTHNEKHNCPYGTCYVAYTGISLLFCMIYGCIFEITGRNLLDNYESKIG